MKPHTPPKYVSIFLICFVLFLLTIGISHFFGIKLIAEKSMPQGIYRLTEKKLQKGDFVLIKIPPKWSNIAKERGYIKPKPFGGIKDVLKYVAAVEGDLVELNEQGLIVNNEIIPFTKPLERDSSNRLMPSVYFEKTTLKNGEFLVRSDNKIKGLDSRYFGILNKNNLIGNCVKIL